MTLVILAAGLGSRFGGLKQVEGVGPNGEFIIDYSIYDAIKAGFDKVVMIIKEENYETFKDTIGKRWQGRIKIEYAFQSNKGIENLIPRDRVKPLGTLHALICAKDYIDEDFAIINADDFYGSDAFMKASEHLRSNSTDSAALPYILKNTLSINGTVNRGVCEADENGYLTHIEETYKIATDGEKIFNETQTFTGEELVSMSLFCIKKELMSFFEEQFQIFLNTKDLSKDESILTGALSAAIDKHKTRIKVINVNSKWHGMTNREDLMEIRSALRKYHDEGIYPPSLN